jgi:hypothetical protein
MLSNLINSIKQDGGITVVDGKKVSYNKGYQVATRDGEEVRGEDLGALVLMLDILEVDSFGMWFDGSSWCVDTSSVYIEDLDEAIAKGKEEGQDAIYEWGTGKSITLK